MNLWQLCAMCIGLTACVFSGCGQRVSFPPEISLKNVDTQQVIVEGNLTLVKHQADGELITLDFSKDDPRPQGTLYRDFLVISHETKGPQKKGKSGISQAYERTTEVIPTRLIASIKFFEKGMIIQLEP